MKQLGQMETKKTKTSLKNLVAVLKLAGSRFDNVVVLLHGYKNYTLVIRSYLFIWVVVLGE